MTVCAHTCAWMGTGPGSEVTTVAHGDQGPLQCSEAPGRKSSGQQLWFCLALFLKLKKHTQQAETHCPLVAKSDLDKHRPRAGSETAV